MIEGGDAIHSSEEAGPGALLSREREARGMSIADISGRLKYSPRQIAALEADDYSKLPGGTFVRGMIRAYAKQVGGDSVLVLALFDRRHVTAPLAVGIQARRIPFPDGKKKATRIYLLLSSLALIAVGAVLVDWHFGADIWNFWKPRHSESSNQVLAVPPFATLTEPTAGVAGTESFNTAPNLRAETAEAKTVGGVDRRVSAQGKVVMQFQRDSWVEVTDAQGAVIMSQLNPAGSSKIIEALPPLFLTIGNAHAVKLTFNDIPVDLKPHVKVDVARLTLE